MITDYNNDKNYTKLFPAGINFFALTWLIHSIMVQFHQKDKSCTIFSTTGIYSVLKSKQLSFQIETHVLYLILFQTLVDFLLNVIKYKIP